MHLQLVPALNKSSNTKAQREAIKQVRVGVRYRDIHWTACRILTEFLIEERILNCDVDEALEHGSHALFFPHPCVYNNNVTGQLSASTFCSFKFFFTF